MNTIITQGIVLRRTNYGEADKIVTVLTPDQGKLSLVAKGVRRLKSKLAGGIELFSVSSLTVMKGRSDLDTLISSRLDIHYRDITRDIERVQMGYELIRLVDKNTEDAPEAEYFSLLQTALAALNDQSVEPELIRVWVIAQLLKLAGHQPNLQTDNAGQALDTNKTYGFDNDSMSFAPGPSRYKPNDIKFLRLLFATVEPAKLMQITDIKSQLKRVIPLVKLWQQQYIH